MKTITSVASFCWAIMLLLGACTTQTAQPGLSSGCDDFVHPDTSSIQLINPNPSEVVALDFSSDGRRLTAVYSSGEHQPGTVLIWDRQTEQIVQEQSLSRAHPRLTSLSATGDILATIQNQGEIVVQHRKEFNFPNEIFRLIEILELSNGTRHKFLPLYESSFATQFIDLSYDGSQILEVFLVYARLNSTDPKIKLPGPSIGTRTASEDPDFVPENFVVGAFDQSNQLIALGYEGGDVELHKVVDPQHSQFNGTLYASPIQGSHKPLALAFSEDNSWLAVLRPNSVEIRDLRLWLLRFWPPLANMWPPKIVYDLPTVEEGKLAFRSQGDLLAMGTPLGWQLRQSNDLSLVMEQVAQPVTALAFSDDGCYVAFGKENGTVDVWVVPQ